MLLSSSLDRSSSMTKKSGSQKKRHTKPCRYFQVNKCPHPADICDFAHVVAIPVVPLNGGPTSCRYYSAGRCNSGASCKYQHGAEAMHVAVSDWMKEPAERPTYNDVPPAYGYPGYNQGWPSSSFSPFSPGPESMLFAAPSRSRDSIDTTSNSISSLDSDDVIVVTDDPQYREHSHSHQSQVCVADDSPIIHVPPFYPTLHINTNGLISPNHLYDYGFSGVMGHMHKSDPFKPRTQAKAVSKQKALRFKTKPCKFFSTERGCPNGSECTFMHDEDWSLSSSPRLSPVKYPSIKDDSNQKNFFPIPWRVIGGGVRVGLARDDESEHPFDTEGPEHQLPQKPDLPAIKVITRRRSNSIPPTPSHNQVKVEHLFSAESPGVL